MADFPIYRLVKGNTLTFTEMDDNLRWLSTNMSGSTVTITGSAINMSGSVSIIGDVQIAGTASIGFIKSEGYSTGSNQLGDDTSDRQTLIGTVSVSGSMSVFGNSVMTGSLAQGSKTIASGRYSHAEGSSSIAIETGSHAEGLYTIASGAYQHVQGQYNATSSVQSAFIVGNGTDDNNRSNLIFAANNTVQITGSLKVLGSITGSLFGTASNSVSSSYALSASYAVSSSYAYTASSAISAYTASSSVSSSYAYTASSAISAYTASSSISSSYAYTASSAISAYTASSSVSSSYAYTASSAISAYTASSSVSSSYSITASHAESLKIGLNLSASSINITNNIVANSITAQSASFGYVQTITGSAVIIGQEYIVLNTQTPSSRYAGLIIYDSGSSTTTASLVWDSQTNHFVYSNGSGSSYSGGGFIAGPKNSGSLADATYPTLNRVLRGQGDDHIYDSNITDDNSKVSVSIPVNVTGSVTATQGFTGSLFGTASSAISSSYTLTSSYANNISGTTNYIPIFTGVNNISTSSIKQSLGSSYSSLEFPASSITGNVANYSDISVFSNESANLYLYSGPVNNKMYTTLQNAYGTISLLFQSGSFNTELLYYEGYSTTNKTLTIGGYQGLVINQNGTGHFKSNLAITGSVTATQGFTGSLFGTASRAISSSYALTASYTTNISGTTNYVSKFTGINSLSNSLVYDNGTSVMINTTSSHSTYSNPRLVVSDASNAYLEVRSVNNQSSLVLSKGTSDTSTTPSVEFFNSGRFGIVMYRPGVVSSNYMMYYDSDSVSNRSLTFQTEGSDRLTLNQTGTVRLNSYTTNGFVKFSGSNGTLAVDTTTYQPLLNGSGYVSMSGTNVNYVSTIPNSGLTNSSITIQGSVTSLGGSVNVINGTGFVKASGTSVTYDNSTYYLASNPNGYTTNTGTVTSITVSPGTGMSGGGTITTSGTVTLTNTAPDQIVALTQGGTTVITGTYPNFTITSNDQYTGTVTGTGTANYLSKFTGTSAIGNSIVYDNGTNVGIGTSTPAAKFVVSNGGASGLEIDPIGGVGSGVLFQAYNRSTSAYMAQSYYALSHTFNVGSGGATRVVDITSGGNVGIGTTSPSAKLHVDDGTGAALFVGLSTNIYYRAYEHIWQGINGTTERMRIDPSGNVGIGTTSPSAKLDVSGSVNIAGDVNLSRATTPAIVSTTNQNIRLRTNSFEGVFRTDGVFITTTGFRTDGFVQTVNLAVGASYYNTAAPTNGAIIQGNVGIGTTSPTTKLEIYSGSGDNYIYTTNGTAATFNGLMVRYNSTNYMGAIGNPSSGEFRIGGFNVSGYYTTIYSNNSETVRVTAGNVGIGTTNNGTDGGVVPRLAVANPSNADKFVGIGYDNTGDYGFIHSIHRATAWKNLAIQAFGGNVGIGTTSPLAKLHVAGELRNSFGSGVGGTNYLNIIDGVSNGFRTTITTGNAITYTFHNGANSEVVSILESGRVGINSTSPIYQLEVTSNSDDLYIAAVGSAPSLNLRDASISASIAGTIGLATNTNNFIQNSVPGDLCISTRGPSSGGAYIIFGSGSTMTAYISGSGDMYIAGALTQGSTRNIKENITPISNALSIVTQIQGVTYDKIDGSAINEPGFIAEDMYSVLPSLVSLDRKGDPQGIKYTNLTAYLLEAIKEQQQQINNLQEQVNKLTNGN